MDLTTSYLICFTRFKRLHKIVSMNISSDHLRPKEHHDSSIFYFTVKVKNYNILYKKNSYLFMYKDF